MAAPGLQALAVRRGITDHIAAHMTDLAIEAVAYRLSFERTAPLHVKAAFEAQRQADIEQLKQIQVLRGLQAKPIDQLKNVGAAQGFIVKTARQALWRPVVLIAPLRG